MPERMGPEEARREYPWLPPESEIKRREAEIEPETTFHESPPWCPFNYDLNFGISFDPWYNPAEWAIVVDYVMIQKYPLVQVWGSDDTSHDEHCRNRGMTEPLGTSRVRGEITLGEILRSVLEGEPIYVDTYTYYSPPPILWPLRYHFRTRLV